jgi:hypothetical protein
MRREYPYLLDAYYEDANSSEIKRNYLAELDNYINQKQYIRITLLNWDELPIKEIQGELSSGTLTKDGSSSVRRSCQFTAALDAGEYDVEDLSLDFSINKKVFIEIGIWNNTKQYSDYPILWFPQGVFFIASASLTSSTTNAVNISLTVKDKMCGLNGLVGGIFPSTTVLDEVETQSASGAYSSEKICIYNLIQELVHHFGNEPLENILIEDIPLRIKRVVKWTGDNPLYLTQTALTGEEKVFMASLDNSDGAVTYKYGEDVGYVYEDFVYTSELTASAGDNIAAILDKIVSYLGNYEYFYDELGIFHFREKKNYLNTTQGKTLLTDMAENDYLIDNAIGKSIYAFSDDSNIVSMTQTPNYEKIKNDFVVQGVRTSSISNTSLPVMYHLAIDNKPLVGNEYYDVLIYKEPSTSLTKIAFPYEVNALPTVGNNNIIYKVQETEEDNSILNHFYYWEDDSYKELVNENSEDEEEVVEDTLLYYEDTPYIPVDWRTELYLQGMLNKYTTTSANIETLITDTSNSSNAYLHPSTVLVNRTNNGVLGSNETYAEWINDLYINQQRSTVNVDFYFTELEAFWPQIYDLKNQKFYEDMETTGCYYLDFIDPLYSSLGEYCISNIGRRTNVTYSQDINCLFEPLIPDVCFILNADGVSEKTEEEVMTERLECIDQDQPYCQVNSNIYNYLATGGSYTAAFEQIQADLLNYTSFQKTIAITALPVFYLDVNTRITMNDKTTNTYGDYIISNISIPFGAGSTMAVSASPCVENI